MLELVKILTKSVFYLYVTSFLGLIDLKFPENIHIILGPWKCIYFSLYPTATFLFYNPKLILEILLTPFRFESSGVTF